jgi:serine/threonine-protein kinase
VSTTNAIEVPSARYGRYILRSRVGTGGMAEVFLAEAVDERGEQLNVAIKLLRKGQSEEAFADEADLMGMLDHPNIVQRLEFGQAFGRPFIAMEFLIGGDLRQVMETHRKMMKSFDAGMGLHVVLEVLKALAYFHTARSRSGSDLHLIHSDVNPSNVFLSGAGVVKLGDFGVASSSRAPIGPGAGIAAGKLSYLSPEQTRGEALTPASDLWAVGVMLHELVVGYHPFAVEGASEEQVMASIRAPKLSIPDYVAKPLVGVLQRALNPDLKVRFRSAGEFAGSIYGYALDNNQVHSPQQVSDWLGALLGFVG